MTRGQLWRALTEAGAQMFCAPGEGSSTSNKASVNGSASNLEVIGVLRVTWKLNRGTGTPTAVGVPPVQVRTMSPTKSVTPSALSCGGTAALTVHANPPGEICASRESARTL